MLKSLDDSENSSKAVEDPQSSLSNPSVDNSVTDYQNVTILPLPTSLVNYRNKNFYMSFLILAAGGLFTAILRTWSALIICSLASVYLAFKALSVEHNYNSGRIVELAAVCTGIRPSFYRDRLSATFTADSGNGESVYYRFIVPNKRLLDDFIVGARYVLYYDKEAKNLLLGYVQVGPEV